MAKQTVAEMQTELEMLEQQIAALGAMPFQTPEIDAAKNGLATRAAALRLVIDKQDQVTMPIAVAREGDEIVIRIPYPKDVTKLKQTESGKRMIAHTVPRFMSLDVLPGVGLQLVMVYDEKRAIKLITGPTPAPAPALAASAYVSPRAAAPAGTSTLRKKLDPK